MQSATAYQLHVFESAEIDTVVLNCQDTLHHAVKFYQASQHAEKHSHRSIFCRNLFTFENHSYLHEKPYLLELLHFKMKDFKLELEPWK